MSTVDELFDQISESDKSGTMLFALRMYDGLALHIDEVRGRIAAGNSDPAFQQSLLGLESTYRDCTGIDPLPNSDREALICRLSTACQKKVEAWKQTPEYAEQQRQLADFTN